MTRLDEFDRIYELHRIPDVEVVSPPALREEVERRLRAALSLYSGNAAIVD